jgi:alkylation response protein AidB-like acyl-CoA dehydrogenase
MALEALLAVASNLETFVEPFKARTDRERKIPTEIVDVMRQNGLLALWLPVDYGGPKAGVTDSIRAIEALAETDGTIGWCACTAAINNRLANFLSSDAAKEIFDSGRASVAGAYAYRASRPHKRRIHHLGEVGIRKRCCSLRLDARSLHRAGKRPAEDE